MDNPQAGRRKKGDKAKEKYERNGGYSTKHVRLATALIASKAALPAATAQPRAGQGSS